MDPLAIFYCLITFFIWFLEIYSYERVKPINTEFFCKLCTENFCIFLQPKCKSLDAIFVLTIYALSCTAPFRSYIKLMLSLLGDFFSFFNWEYESQTTSGGGEKNENFYFSLSAVARACGSAFEFKSLVRTFFIYFKTKKIACWNAALTYSSKIYFWLLVPRKRQCNSHTCPI